MKGCSNELVEEPDFCLEEDELRPPVGLEMFHGIFQVHSINIHKKHQGSFSGGCPMHASCSSNVNRKKSDRLQAGLAGKGQTVYLKCSRPNCDAHGCMKMQSGLHEAPKTALSPALMIHQDL